MIKYFYDLVEKDHRATLNEIAGKLKANLDNKYILKIIAKFSF